MKSRVFRWTPKRRRVAELLAAGHTVAEAARLVGVSEAIIYRWKHHPEFLNEIDNLTLSTHLAQKAERLRMAYRVIREKAQQASRKDLLDWLEYLRQEIDGTKHELDIGSALTAILERLTGAGNTPDENAG